MPYGAGENTQPVVESDQMTDTFIRVMLDNAIIARLLSASCQEAREQSLPNQDFAQILCRDGSTLCFCVCDGVGSSYKGDFAAHYLGGCLIEWLQSLTGLQQDPAMLAGILQAHLDRRAHEAQESLKRMGLPPETPHLVREVLEDLCNSYGSETVFLCGRIDYGGWSSKLGALSPIRALFCWMGNVTAWLFLAPGQFLKLGGEDENGSRWSTVRGCRGPITAWSLALTTIDRLIIHTDGLDPLGGSLVAFSDEEWQAQAERLRLLPKSDDMTALELRWLHGKEHAW